MTDMSASSRMYAWKTWAAFGGHLLDQRFDTPREAGEWRREQFGDDHHGLTLVAVDDGLTLGVTSGELCEAHFAWLRPDHESSGGEAVNPAAA